MSASATRSFRRDQLGRALEAWADLLAQLFDRKPTRHGHIDRGGCSLRGRGTSTAIEREPANSSSSLTTTPRVLMRSSSAASSSRSSIVFGPCRFSSMVASSSRRSASEMLASNTLPSAEQ